jgi:glycosyltransferase involved in cell wall biosynthesis
MISVVIPTQNAEATLAGTLSALVPGVVEGLIKDVIVVDTGSDDATLEIADATGCRIISVEAERGLQLWAGCKAATGDWLLILHADSVVGEGWMDGLRNHMKHRPLRAGYFQLTFDDRSWLWGLRAELMGLRARFLGLPGEDHGLFLSRALYDSVGGFKDQTDFEELALVMALGRTRIKPLAVTLISGTERFRRPNRVLDGLKRLLSFGLYLLGVPPKPRSLPPKA